METFYSKKDHIIFANKRFWRLICKWWFTYYIRDEVKLAQLVRAQDCSSRGRRFVSGKNPPKTENSNLHGFELHRPWSKSTKLLLQVIKAIINQYQQDGVPINMQSKKISFITFYLHNFCLQRILSSKKAHSFHIKSHIEHIFFVTKYHLWGIWCQCLAWYTNSLVLKMIRIQIPSDHKNKTGEKQWRKYKITNPLSKRTSWNTNRTTNSIPKSL